METDTRCYENHDKAVCFQQNQRNEVRPIGGDGKVAGALAAESGAHQQNYVVGFNGGQSKDGGLGLGEDVSPSIRAQSSALDPSVAYAVRTGHTAANGCGVSDCVAHTQDCAQPEAVVTRAAVRRLTPLECERLMGFPDGWTRIPWKGKPAEDCPDGPRYKACGNSMCVNCMEWIGTRIQQVEEETEK